MAEHPFHKKLRRKIDDRVKERHILLAEGFAKNYETYREEVGYIRGLTDALVYCEMIEDEENQ